MQDDDTPLILMDKTGSRRETELKDDDRCYSIVTSMEHQHQTALQLFCRHAPRYTRGVPLCSSSLSFGPNYSPGTFWLQAWSAPVQMEEFFPRRDMRLGKTQIVTRRFVASDGQEYFWSRGLKIGEEYTCTNGRRYNVASYELADEDHSKNVLIIDATFAHLDIELISTLWMMRCLHPTS